MSETNYIRFDKVIIKDKSTDIDFTDYREQDLSPEEGRTELKKWVSIPGVAHNAFELALKKLIPHFLTHCHLQLDKKLIGTVNVKAIEFKGAHRDTVLPTFEVEGSNLAPFKIVGPEIYIHDAESKKFETAISDFLSELEAHIVSKDSPVQLIIDFTQGEKVEKKK